MKKLILLVAVILLNGCKSEPELKEVTITSDEVKEIVEYLASDAIQGRDTGSEGIELSAQYLENKFEALGVDPYFETYRDNFKIDSINAFNVVGHLKGGDDKLQNEIIVIGAHYDHVGYRAKAVEGDSIANGANDNATGAAAVMALANYFAQRKNNKRSVVFVLFSGEEMGLRGSRHLAEKMKNANANIYTVVNFEMIGVPFIDRDYDALLTGYDLSNMASKINEYANANVVGKSDVAVQYNLFKRSDNYPFYQEFEVPSQTIGSCDLTNYDFYHHVDDEADKMDYVHMANLINKLAPAIEMMSNTEAKEIVMNKETENE